jgi:hypothetical protein
MKVKFFLYLTEKHNTKVCGEYRFCFACSKHSHWMGVRSQVNDMCNLALERELLLPFEWKAKLSSGPVWLL